MKIADEGARDIFEGIDSRKARSVLPRALHGKAARLLDRLNAASKPDDLRTPKGNRLHQLHGRERRWGLRINDQYRICFKWESGEAIDVKIVDYH